MVKEYRIINTGKFSYKIQIKVERFVPKLFWFGTKKVVEWKDMWIPDINGEPILYTDPQGNIRTKNCINILSSKEECKRIIDKDIEARKKKAKEETISSLEPVEYYP